MSSMTFLVDIITVLMLYGPAYLANTGAMLFGKWLPDKAGIPVFVIDSGRIHSDGNRILGDGKTWNGMFGGAFFSGILMVLAHKIWFERTLSEKPFVDPMGFAQSSDWFWLTNEWVAAFTIGFILGFACLIGDSLGSFVKRRRGLKREGNVSSSAPILDTLPFAIMIFIAAFILFPGQIFTENDFHLPILSLLILTPIIHRSFNILGYKLGLKDVPF